jgi:glycosyltransferase involved in cell wall biosynthesis
VRAANQTGAQLVVVGDGRERKRLERIAGPTVKFLGRRPDEEVTQLYRRCRAFLFPGFEDFGITAVEAQASGRPVIAYGRGGATETVVHKVTGVLFDEQEVDALADALVGFRSADYDPAACRRNAERFDRTIFRERIRDAVSLGGSRPAAGRPDGNEQERLRETA